MKSRIFKSVIFFDLSVPCVGGGESPLTKAQPCRGNENGRFQKRTVYFYNSIRQKKCKKRNPWTLHKKFSLKNSNFQNSSLGRKNFNFLYFLKTCCKLSVFVNGTFSFAQQGWAFVNELSPPPRYRSKAFVWVNIICQKR